MEGERYSLPVQCNSDLIKWLFLFPLAKQKYSALVLLVLFQQSSDETLEVIFYFL